MTCDGACGAAAFPAALARTLTPSPPAPPRTPNRRINSVGPGRDLRRDQHDGGAAQPVDQDVPRCGGWDGRSRSVCGRRRAACATQQTHCSALDLEQTSNTTQHNPTQQTNTQHTTHNTNLINQHQPNQSTPNRQAPVRLHRVHLQRHRRPAGQLPPQDALLARLRGRGRGGGELLRVA